MSNINSEEIKKELERSYKSLLSAMKLSQDNLYNNLT